MSTCCCRRIRTKRVAGTQRVSRVDGITVRDGARERRRIRRFGEALVGRQVRRGRRRRWARLFDRASRGVAGKQRASRVDGITVRDGARERRRIRRFGEALVGRQVRRGRRRRWARLFGRASNAIRTASSRSRRSTPTVASRRRTTCSTAASSCCESRCSWSRARTNLEPRDSRESAPPGHLPAA